jgi:hypothetical protein
MPYKDPEKRRECARRWASKAYAANPEKFRQQCQERRTKDPKKARAQSLENNRRRTARDPEGIRRKKRVYRLANLDKIAAYKERIRQEDPDHFAREAREYRAKNPQKSALISLRASTRRRKRCESLPETFTTEQQTFMLQYWGYACAACGNQEGFKWKLSRDHWIAVAAPDCPGTVATNMVPLCHGVNGCNNTKRHKDAHKWLLKRFGPRKAKKIEKAIATYFAIVKERFGHSESSSAAAD